MESLKLIIILLVTKIVFGTIYVYDPVNND